MKTAIVQWFKSIQWKLQNGITKTDVDEHAQDYVPLSYNTLEPNEEAEVRLQLTDADAWLQSTAADVEAYFGPGEKAADAWLQSTAADADAWFEPNEEAEVRLQLTDADAWLQANLPK